MVIKHLLTGMILQVRGWGFPHRGRIHTAYIGEDSSILGTRISESFGEYVVFFTGDSWGVY